MNNLNSCKDWKEFVRLKREGLFKILIIPKGTELYQGVSTNEMENEYISNTDAY